VCSWEVQQHQEARGFHESADEPNRCTHRRSHHLPNVRYDPVDSLGGAVADHCHRVGKPAMTTGVGVAVWFAPAPSGPQGFGQLTLQFAPPCR